MPNTVGTHKPASDTGPLQAALDKIQEILDSKRWDRLYDRLIFSSTKRLLMGLKDDITSALAAAQTSANGERTLIAGLRTQLGASQDAIQTLTDRATELQQQLDADAANGVTAQDLTDFIGGLNALKSGLDADQMIENAVANTDGTLPEKVLKKAQKSKK